MKAPTPAGEYEGDRLADDAAAATEPIRAGSDKWSIYTEYDPDVWERRSPVWQEIRAADRREARIAKARAAGPWIVGAVVLVAVVGAAWFFWFRTTTERMEVVEKVWSRSVEAEVFAQDEDSTWNRWSIPDDAYDRSSRWEIRSWRSESYSCGYERSTDGSSRTKTCTRDVPVYGDRHYFTVDRWVSDGWITEGHSTAHEGFVEPFWPNRDLGPSDPVFDNRRWAASPAECDEGSAHCVEVLRVRLVGGDRSHLLGVEADQWESLRVGTVVTAHVTASGRVRSVEVER